MITLSWATVGWFESNRWLSLGFSVTQIAQEGDCVSPTVHTFSRDSGGVYKKKPVQMIMYTAS